LFLIGILVLLLLAPVNSGAIRGARQLVFGKPIATRVQSTQEEGGDQMNSHGSSIGRLPEGVRLRPPTNEVRAGAAGTDEPAEQVGAPEGTNVINDALEDRGTTNGRPQTLLLDDFSQRLQQAGARSGDVQISLEWKNKNDLDLHVFDPFGEEIYYRHRKSQSGGQLDVDMNLVRLVNGKEFPEDIERLTDRPVENVYWPERGAPRGLYRVEVAHYARHGGIDPTAFSVRIINRGQALYYRGAVTFNANPARGRVAVCTFMVQ
jgi:hypothetical protein